jgi:hypothetical protein
MTHARKTSDNEPQGGPESCSAESTIRHCQKTPPQVRRQSDPSFTLDQRMSSKLGLAQELLAKLEPQDARARLLQIAVLRRDESLLDGILAELARPPTTR